RRALETLAPLSAGPWPSADMEAEYRDEIARDEDALGRPREAREELERAVALDPTAERRFRLSQLAERLGDREEARRQLEAAAVRRRAPAHQGRPPSLDGLRLHDPLPYRPLLRTPNPQSREAHKHKPGRS